MQNEKEIKKLKEALDDYIYGAIDRDYMRIYNSWHPDAEMMSENIEDGNLKRVPSSFWKDVYEKNPPTPETTRESEIENIDIHGTAANARIKTIIDGPEKCIIFTDFINLLRLGEKWQIVNKIFHTDVIEKE
jgi:hypothetical protein